MPITTKTEIMEILSMPYADFNRTIKAQAKGIQRSVNADRVLVTALLGYDNVCKNQCTYCGMRAGYPGLTRFRLSLEDIKKTTDAAVRQGLERIFFVSGEDPRYDFKDILAMLEYAKSLGLHVSLGAGELSREKYTALKEAGLDEYVLKFETSDPVFFTRIKPSTTFERRMKCIEDIQSSRIKLASGNIVGLPHQNLEQVADDILMMKKLEISWAPIIPYLPVPNTPLALEGGRGSIETLLKEIAILRIMMPSVNITAQQPGEDPKSGLSDKQGNLNALAAGANMLFVDMLPVSLIKDFHVIEGRMLEGFEKVKQLVAEAGMRL